MGKRTYRRDGEINADDPNRTFRFNANLIMSFELPYAVMSAQMLQSILVVLLAFSFYDAAYAEEGLYGCWDNIQQGTTYIGTPPHQVPAAFGDQICFKRDGVVETAHIGALEGFGSGGKFLYKNGHLLLRRTEDTPEGWFFAVDGRDRCSVSIVRGQLTIRQCNGWAPSHVLILNKRTSHLPE